MLGSLAASEIAFSWRHTDPRDSSQNDEEMELDTHFYELAITSVYNSGLID